MNEKSNTHSFSLELLELKVSVILEPFASSGVS